jgi:hypothetical protein
MSIPIPIPPVTPMSDLFFPFDVVISAVSSYGIPTHPVDIAASAAGIETRTLLSQERSQGFIECVVDNEFDSSNESLEEFHQAVSTTHLSFLIKDVHNIWDLIPEHSRRKFLPYWRFDSQLVFTSDNPRACLYTTSIKLINVKL